MGRAIGPGAI